MTAGTFLLQLWADAAIANGLNTNLQHLQSPTAWSFDIFQCVGEAHLVIRRGALSQFGEVDL